MGGLKDEVFWSLYCIAKFQRILNETNKIVIQSLWKAFEYDPSRAEPLFDLIEYYFAEENYPLAGVLHNPLEKRSPWA